ncbi:hypothetical protein BDZ94DRAFT_1304130 [Collybia nuda]|uniref:Uncharacterized protein n=1 Tax=Collybia nuda TaxID=64659 RepID=A0A9P5YHZ9_9AGAR|nr:hypothetical protein BDZ94DRAFT_1304130 [Collybia nuda]
MTTTQAPNTYTRKRKSKKYDPSASDICSDEASEERTAKRWKKQDDILSSIKVETTESIRQKEKEKKRLEQEPTAVENDEDLDQDKAIGKKDKGKLECVKRKNKEKAWSKKQAAANVGDPRPYEDTATKVERLAIPSTLGSTKKKKRTNKTCFLDPTEDTSLSDQAHKGFLSIRVHTILPTIQMEISQSATELDSQKRIPDAYFPLAVAYLTKVQGGARENLLKHCILSLEPSKVQGSAPETITPDASVTSTIPALPAIDLAKLTRAKALIHDLNVNVVANG